MFKLRKSSFILSKSYKYLTRVQALVGIRKICVHQRCSDCISGWSSASKWPNADITIRQFRIATLFLNFLHLLSVLKIDSRCYEDCKVIIIHERESKIFEILLNGASEYLGISFLPLYQCFLYYSQIIFLAIFHYKLTNL